MTSTTPNIEATSMTEILPKNWEMADKNISANDVIDAYFKGKKDGAMEQFEKMKQEFWVNLKLASSISEELLSNAKDNKIQIDEVYLKATNFNSFNVLFLVDDTDDIKELSKAYILSTEIKKKYRTQRFHIDFAFSENSETLSKDCIAADGYLVRYGQTAKA
jgi:hypothetical protein